MTTPLKTIGDKVEPSSNDACVALPTGWRLHIADSCENASRFAGRTLALLLRDKPNLLLCAATGGSPARTYEEFVDAVMADPALLHPLRLLKLDEWGGLAMDDRATCEAYLRERLVDPLRIPEERFISFRSDALSPAVECHRIERWLLDHGPIDVCVLGLGLNGHLGFNEPAVELTVAPHVARLSDASLAHSMLTRALARPSHGLTLGMGDILASRSIVLLVFGNRKAEQLNRLLTGGATSHFPASFLTLHRDVLCVCDEAAAARLPRKVPGGSEP